MRKGTYNFNHKTCIVYAISHRVLVVASIDEHVGDFSVYIDRVEGVNHEQEFKSVKKFGDKLEERLAKVIFPDLFEKYTWRD